ncbi:MAG TPA: NAD-dependent epimerase/dehydratase family protein [Verrucomicrobiae bacterium]|nr:NAD-dependent epimerase/dehydratase family protein [Verrucomicrobiae bacterium]
MNRSTAPANRDWASRRVLVTGANGFVGRWLVETLAARGAKVHALIRGSAENFSHAGKINYVHGSVTDLNFISQIVNDANVEIVFHLAAINTNTGDRISPYDIFEINTRGTYTILEACRKAPKPVPAVIASSKEVEDCFCPASGRKHHPYMVSKAATELIARTYFDAANLPVTLVRLDNVYGGGDFNWNRLIPGMIRTVLRGERPVIRSNGLFERDYVYVEDAVAAFLAIGERIEQPGVQGQLFRVATGVKTSVLSVVQQIIQLAGQPDLTPQVLNEKTEARVDAAYAPELEKRILGWLSRISLAEGLARTCRWYQNYFQKE